MLLNFTQRGEGPPLILIHGLFGSSANLGMVSRGLSESFTCYSVDVRNHGESPHCPTMDYGEMALDIVKLMDHLSIPSCSILGHSMGGKIAMQVAMDYSDRINKLVIADVAPVTYPPHHDDTLAGLLALERASISSRREADELLAHHVGEAGVRAFLLKSFRKGPDGLFKWQMNRAAIAANYENLGSANVGPGFDGPALFLKGGDSDYVLAEHEPAVRSLFPQASVKVIEGTGHWLHAEKPNIFNKLVLRFLLS